MNKKIVWLQGIFMVTMFACSAPVVGKTTNVDVPSTTIVLTTNEETVVDTSEELAATPTSKPNVAPVFQMWTSQDVIAVFVELELEVGEYYTMTKDDYGASPYVAVEGTRFLIPSLCETCGGRILVFANIEDLELSKSYYVELGRQSALFFSWVFEKDNVLVQINGDLDEGAAAEYEDALNSLGG